MTPPQPTPHGSPAVGLRILVAAGTREPADALAEVLRLCGADVKVCYDATTAAREAAGFQPEVGLFEVDHPGLDGCELARRVRASAGRRPLLLIAVTAATGLPDLRRVVEAGFNMHLLKPADPAALVPSLADFAGWLRGRRAAPAPGTG